MKTNVAVVLWVLGVFVAMLGSSALDAWNKRREQAQQINSILEELLKDTCPNPVCNCEKCDCGSNCECNLIQEVEEQLSPRVEPAPVAKPRLIMHTINGCPPCEADKRCIVNWIDTWDVEILNDSPGASGQRYPWYEVEELDGTRFQFVGQLSREAVERGRRNVARAN